ncbi:phage tail tape measure protein [Enterococcus lactis]|uniref:Phage tail tape measure protein n=1 Tax=Enterococcus lactis TaxID=357441 RepID=A0AAW4QLL8_9ENTE|nr:phage tail tape measure protein [Enterococcus lactis]MBX4194938.1 phage tail tape measure protein [Enterococcus lactis]MBX4227704.1 phage tail tape measure protein [Enterococcus lactis]
MANGKPIGNMKVILDLDSSAFSKGLEGAKKSVAYNTKAMKAQMQVMNYSGDKVGALQAKYDGLSKTLSSNEKYMSKLKTQYDKSFDANGKATASTAKYANELNQAIAKSASYEAQMKTTTGQIARMKVETEGVTGKLKAQSDQWIKSGKKIESFGKKMSSIGSTLTMSVTAPIAAGFGLATKKAVDFQTQIGEIGPLLTNGGKMTTEYRNQLDQMSDSSKKWAKEYGVSTTEINTGLAEIVRKGYDANQTLGVMPSILDATKASGDDFNDVMNVTTEVISQFNLKGKDYNSTVKNATRVTDALTYVANATSAGFSDLGLAMGYVGPVANSLGMDVEETASAIGLLSDAGIGGEKAGTALRGALTRLLKPSKQNIAGFEQLGISVDEFKNGTLTLPDMLNKIKVNTEGWTDAQRTSAIALAFGTESQSAMNVLVNQGGDALKGLTKETYNANGATKEIAKSMNNLPANKLARFKESLNVLAITAGEKLLPIFTPIIEKSTKLINKFSELDDASQKNIIKWVGIAAAAGPTLKLLGGGIAVVGKTQTAVGKLTGSLVDLVAKAAQKKAMDSFSTTVTTIGTTAANTAGAGGLGSLTSALGQSASAASAAAGSGGIGAFTGSLGLLSPALLGIVGVGGALALGYGAWKTFGEEAWNSSQRVKEWGSDVGSQVDSTLDTVKEKTNETSGQFGLMVQGFDQDTGPMVKNFETIGATIESSLTKKVEGLDNLLKNLPGTVTDSMKEIIENEKEMNQSALEKIQENNDRIKEIREKASKEHRDISVAEAQMISDLSKNTAEQYVNTLDVSAEQRKAILNSMTGDVSQASKEQAETWLKSLGEQRNASQNHTAQMRKEQEKWLKDWGYNLDGEFAQKYLAEWDKINDATTDGFDSQIAAIVEKYPELADKIHLATGEVIAASANTSQYLIEDNQKLLDNAGYMADKLAENAKKNADTLKWVAKEGTDGAKEWNSLELLDKEGNVKTNAPEIIKEASKNITTWNNLKMVLHDANIDSNAKKMIGEAAIANDLWRGMAWEDKEAVLQDEFSINVYKALESSGKWDELDFEQKKAVLYSNTPEVMAETLFNLGLWNDYQPEIKNLNAKNYDFLQTLSKSEEKLKIWNETPVDIKELFAKNTDFLNKIFSSEEKLNLWNSIPDSEKKLLADNMDFLTKISTSKETLNQWNQLPTDQKNILANNEDLLNKIFASEESFNAWKSIPDPVKRMLGDNVDILTKVKDGTISIEDYNKNVLPLLKKLFGDNSGLTGAVGDASATIDNYNKNVFLNDKTAVGHDEASQAAKDAFEAFNIFQTKIPDKITKTVSADFIGPMPKNAKGTNFHPGGAAMVNDQKGPTYEELITLPSGEAFIPKGRNVVLDLPRGSKVLNATKTKRLVPKYADGIGNITTISTAPNFDALILAINELTAVLRSQQPISNQSTTDTKVAQPIIPDALSEKSDQYLAIGSEWLTNLMNGWNSVVPQYMSSETLFITNYLNALKSQNNPSYLQGATWNKNLMNGWNSLTGTFIATINSFCNQAMVTLRNYNTPMYNNGRTWQQNNLNGWNSLYGSFIARVNQLGNDSINNLRSKNGGFYNAGSFLLQSLINGMNSMGNSLASTMNSVANTMVGGMGKGVNGVISGVNYVLKEVESSKSIGNWAIPQYAKGTEGHPGGLAMINDKKGLVHEEYVQMPDGRGFIAKGRDLLVNLPKGAQVLNASLTKKLKERLNIPHYEKGVGNLDIVDLLDDEKRMLEFLTSKVDFSGINEPWLDMTKSGTSLMSKAANTMLQSKLSEFFTHGNFDGAVNANGVYQYLVDVAQKVMGKFPGLTVTSGYRAGDAYYHGKRQAIDLAYPGISGDPRYTAAANYAFEKFPSKIAYVITNGRVRDRMGLSGTGSSGQWTNWQDGDHFDHIHLNGSMGSGDIFTGGGAGGGGVARWRSYVSKALKMNGLPATAAYMNAWMSQIQTESGGNEKAIGGNDGLAEGNATGLLQTKPGTFAANAFPGHGNIMNGFDNMLAAINYAKKRYGVAGMLQVIGKGHGYANGGLITKDGLYRAGEGNKPEMVIPLTRKTRAIELMGQALAFLSGDDKKRSNTANTADNSAELVALIKQQQKQHNELMMILRAILGKDLSLKSSDIGQAANHYMGSDLNKLRYANGGV